MRESDFSKVSAFEQEAERKSHTPIIRPVDQPEPTIVKSAHLIRAEDVDRLHNLLEDMDEALDKGHVLKARDFLNEAMDLVRF